MLTERELAIQGFMKAVVREWENGNTEIARFLESRVTAMENMTEEEFHIHYPGEKTIYD